MPVDRWQWYRRRYRNRRWTLAISYSSVSTTTIGATIVDEGWMNRWKKERPRKIKVDQSFKQHHANIVFTTDFLNTGRSVGMDTPTITERGVSFDSGTWTELITNCIHTSIAMEIVKGCLQFEGGAMTRIVRRIIYIYAFLDMWYGSRIIYIYRLLLGNITTAWILFGVPPRIWNFGLVWIT